MARTRKRSDKLHQTQVVTTGSTVRIETPASDRQHKPSVVTVVAQEINPVSGFVGFLREHAVVGLAVGFIIGQQAQGVVKNLVSSFIDPLFILLGGQALSQRSVTLHWHTRSAPFAWGSFVYVLLNFIFVMLAIYVIIKFFNLDKLDKPKEKSK